MQTARPEDAGPRAQPAPRVTVGMPAFNNADTIARAIRSVIAQTVGDWVLMVSDDASADDTAAIARSFLEIDSRIRVVRQEKNLLYMNFGFLLDQARTPCFAWIAADDQWHPTFLERCLAALESSPDAVSALPRCAFTDRGAIAAAPPDTGSLTGSWPERALGFLDRPSGTRMYGLFRTEPLRRAFPRRNMHAYDYAMMLAVLREGSQVEVDVTLMTRSRTPWRAYARSAHHFYRSRIFRSFPLLDMTLHALRRGAVPLRPAVLGRLAWLNACKHEEMLLVVDPVRYLRRFRLFRALGLPLSRNPFTRLMAARDLLEGECDPPARAAALGVLDAAAAEGLADADLVLGHHFRAQGTPAGLRRAAGHFRRGARPGENEGLFLLAAAEEQAGRIARDERARVYLKVAETGSHAAASQLGALVLHGETEGIDLRSLRGSLERAHEAGFRGALVPLVHLLEAGLGGPPDTPRALRLLRRAAPKDAAAARELARLLLARGEAAGSEEAEGWLEHAASLGDPAARLALARSLLDGDDAAQARGLGLLLEAHAAGEAVAADHLRRIAEPALLAAAAERIGLSPHGAAEARTALAELGFLPSGARLTPERLARLWRDTRPA